MPRSPCVIRVYTVIHAFKKSREAPWLLGLHVMHAFFGAHFFIYIYTLYPPFFNKSILIYIYKK